MIFFSLIFRERGRERGGRGERNIDWLPPTSAQTRARYQTHKRGTCRPWLGIESEICRCLGWCSNYWENQSGPFSMFLRSIHVAAGISIIFLFMAEYSSIAWIDHIFYPSTDRLWVVSTFQLLWIMLLCIFMYKCLFASFQFFFGYSQEWNWS